MRVSSISMATIHISAAEAVRDFARLLARVRAGAEVVIEDDTSPAVVLRAAVAPRGRLISESIALAEAHAKELGYETGDGCGVRRRSRRDYPQPQAA